MPVGVGKPGDEWVGPPPSVASRPPPASFAEFVEASLVPLWDEGWVDDPRSPAAAPQLDDGDADTSAGLSALLAQIARIPEVELDVSAGWTPGLAAGDRVGPFVLLREIGRGSLGVVFEALDPLGRDVAFKALRPGGRVRGEGDWPVRAEAEAVARLDHPNLAALHGFGQGPRGPYLVFELLRGETMADRLRAGALLLRDAVDVAVDVARVLTYVHAAGVAHRDLEPANVFLCEDGTVKVLDVGLAHLFGRGGVAGGGTPAYLAPERWRSEPGDARADLFALGVLLHRMVSGALPYRATRAGTEALEPGPPPRLPGAAPEPLRRIVARMLEKPPEARPRSAQEVLDVLLTVQRWLAGGAARGPGEPRP